MTTRRAFAMHRPSVSGSSWLMIGPADETGKRYKYCMGYESQVPDEPPASGALSLTCCQYMFHPYTYDSTKGHGLKRGPWKRDDGAGDWGRETPATLSPGVAALQYSS
ncbi:hypothetical protein TNIN_175121 [Trichonephila inaurata madagascariensis]|uniref:Uncharacterized protein n=1 Tax=Trichonephila inaurata madagascariensis TaxID=2747483 RepID=A0A8X7C581_9ARAC|nr:hypothetical protein TNIN_175121 [Trichonephila inaurata madagascariensis]